MWLPAQTKKQSHESWRGLVGKKKKRRRRKKEEEEERKKGQGGGVEEAVTMSGRDKSK